MEVSLDPALVEDQDLREAMEAIPGKMGFKIGEVAELVGVKPYVLRYWESEFDDLKPKKSNHNQRMYSPHDVKIVLMVKKLLYKDRFSIEGAKKTIKRLKTQVKQEEKTIVTKEREDDAIQDLKGMLENINRLRKVFL